jgi:F420-non-reducing hydrogenase iron-sulfur subunit
MVPPSMVCDSNQPTGSAAVAAVVTVFVCANCARPGQTPDSAGRSRLNVPRFDWPISVREVLVPCTGRIQPEHVLKAFESGARLVCAVACQEDNCHYLEGSARCARRMDYLRTILDDIGLGGERLMLFHLPGSAAEDTALGAGRAASVCAADVADAPAAAVRDAVLRALGDLAPTPFDIEVSEGAEHPYQEVDTSEDADED